MFSSVPVLFSVCTLRALLFALLLKLLTEAVHWRYYRTNLAPEFWLLVDCLDAMSRRWAGSLPRAEGKLDIAAKYSSQLRALHTKCSGDPDFSLDVLGYSTDGFPDETTRAQRERGAGVDRGSQENGISPRAGFNPAPVPNTEGVEAPTGDIQRFVPDSRLSSILQVSPTNPHLEQHSQDELSAISTALMDQDFTQLDRVISFDDDMLFEVQTGHGDATALPGGGWNFG